MAQAQEARGLHVARALHELRPAPTVFIANEVLDALPVHRVHGTAEGLREGYVSWDGARFLETVGPMTVPPLSASLAPGDVVEVNADAETLLRAMADAAPRGIALFLDYAAGPPRPGGSWRGYHEHRVTDALERPGEQDITADVDFADVAARAQAAGWDVLGERAQGEFLAVLGLLDDMMAAMARGDTEAYLAGKNLLMPTGMGERFRVLVLGRGIPREPALPGLRADTFPGASRR
jgi:SAM-dependent MidA family methyltransferase